MMTVKRDDADEATRTRWDNGDFTHDELVEMTAWVASTTNDPMTVARAVEKPWRFWVDYCNSLEGE